MENVTIVILSLVVVCIVLLIGYHVHHEREADKVMRFEDWLDNLIHEEFYKAQCVISDLDPKKELGNVYFHFTAIMGRIKPHLEKDWMQFRNQGGDQRRVELLISQTVDFIRTKHPETSIFVDQVMIFVMEDYKAYIEDCKQNPRIQVSNWFWLWDLNTRVKTQIFNAIETARREL